MMLSRILRRGMSCEQVMEVLQSYLDGEIDTPTARFVATHLDRCPPCEHESHVYERIKTSLGRRRVELDETVAQALADYIERVTKGEIA